ncbi:MAG TPA: COX15/CtaA family protein [Candidatus Eisenbacteria bacterium]|nr:COX15/CtaA family protein [Candidatus Eisenbacteria bacterium]
MPTRSFAVASRLGLATAIVMFGLIVVGSVVRTTGSGLSCPDWPLCQGRLIPAFEFHVLIEWFHRLLALWVGLLLAMTVVHTAARAPLRARLGALASVAVALYLTQALLGALTVWKLLNPIVVGSHLAVALLLFSTLVAFTFVARRAAREQQGPARAATSRPAGLLPMLGGTTALAYVQCLLGGMVSTNHAGLACPDWPLCNGSLVPTLAGPVGMQVMHRLGAYALTLAVMATLVRARAADGAVLRGVAAAFTLVAAQIAIGVTAIALQLPPWASALHLANAALILITLLVTTLGAARLPARAPLGASAPVAAA